MALDCEMVGTEEDGSGAMCARVCIVDVRGSVLLSTFVAPDRPITDHRTKLTGVDPGSSSERRACARSERPCSPCSTDPSAPPPTTTKLSSWATTCNTTSSAWASSGPGGCAGTPRGTHRCSVTHAPFKLRTLAADHLGESIQREGWRTTAGGRVGGDAAVPRGIGALSRASRRGAGRVGREDRVGRTRAEDRVGRARATARGCAPTAGRGGRSRRSRRRGLDAGAGISSRVRGFRAPDARGDPRSTRLPSRLRHPTEVAVAGIPPTRTRPRSDDDDGRGEDIMVARRTI